MSLRVRLAVVLLMGSVVLLGVQAATQAEESHAGVPVAAVRWNDEDVPVAAIPSAVPASESSSAAAHPNDAAAAGTIGPTARDDVRAAPGRLPSVAAGRSQLPTRADHSGGRSARVDLRPWARGLAPKVGIPEVALAAYGAAEVQLARDRPGCHLSWVALAGIGSVESDHGRHGGATLLDDGTATRRVIGVALNGDGVGRVADTDHGALDGDRTSDHAVGPMQFIPRTWTTWAVDGDGDGIADPFSLPDAALAAGRYLCAAGAGDLRLPAPWTRAVWAYNHSGAYLGLVTRRSNAYAMASLAPRP